MANSGQGPATPGADLERLARQYWEAWQDALQRTMPGQGGADAMSGFGLPGAGAVDPWRAALDGWMHQAAAQRPGIDDTLSRFNAQAGDWMARMQQLASRFAGHDSTPEAVTQAWREMLGGGANPFAQMFAGLQGPGIEGWDTFVQRLAPLFGQGGPGRDWSRLPTFGLTREHQERWQGLARAFTGYQGSQQGFQRLLAQASQGAFGHFERRLREAQAAPIDSPRALFDLWIDAAEEAYAEVAMSPPFRIAYAEMVAGQMRLRQAVQGEIEALCRMLDLPTRSELDGAHRKAAELERGMRRLRDRLDALEGGAAPAASDPEPASTGARNSGAGRPAGVVARAPARTKAAADAGPARTAAKSMPGKQPAAGRAGGRPVIAKQAAARTSPAGQGAAKKAAARKGAAKKRTVAKKAAADGHAAQKRSAASAPARAAKGSSGVASRRPQRAVAPAPSRVGGSGVAPPIPEQLTAAAAVRRKR